MSNIFKIAAFFLITYILFTPYDLYKFIQMKQFSALMIVFICISIFVYKNDTTMAILLLLVVVSMILRFGFMPKMPNY